MRFMFVFENSRDISFTTQLLQQDGRGKGAGRKF